MKMKTAFRISILEFCLSYVLLCLFPEWQSAAM